MKERLIEIYSELRLLVQEEGLTEEQTAELESAMEAIMTVIHSL